MRKFIIDTDTASDDAAAIMIAAMEPDVEILGVTVVAGNVSVEQAALNALATLEVCKCDAPVYLGQYRPLFKERKETISVHGADGMGDCGLINPVGRPADGRAVEFILDQVARYPGEVEIAVLGPATNVALAVLTDREVMKKVKHIWSMGTPGFGSGNATPVSEFNVFIDAEAYALMLDAGVPITIAGFDLCTAEIGFDETELLALANGNEIGRFLVKATSQLAKFNERARGIHVADLPDAIAMAAALWPDFVKSSVKCHCSCVTAEGSTYGQVIFYQDGRIYESMPTIGGNNAEVITAVDEKIFTKRFMTALLK